MTSLKLVALDEEDLEILSAHLQDALVRTEDIAWQPGNRRFVTLLNRFDWEKALAGEERGRRDFERWRSALRFDRVDGVQLKNINIKKRGQILNLLSISFTAGDAPSGYVELIFADDRSIRLFVECIEAELTDLGQSWKARSKPGHE